jgi:exopolysaccharide biosynthesis polyprenyl glycosylphosphotransferase
MSKPTEKLLLIVIDFLTINASFFALTMYRQGLDLFVAQGFLIKLYLSGIVYILWLLVFLFFGLYQSWYLKSRFDEFVAVFKAVTFGCITIFILTIDINRDISSLPSVGRIMIISYWLTLILFIGGGRLVLHTIQRSLLEIGVGTRNTVIVGWNPEAHSLFDKIEKYPALGYKVIGFINTKNKPGVDEYKGVRLLDSIKQISKIVDEYRIEEIILALSDMPHKKVVNIIAQCQDLPVNLKIVPSMYDIVLGQARINQIYGFPLIEIQPELLSPWELRIKRFIDISISLAGLIILLPVFIITGILIQLNSPGPIFFRQKRVGKNNQIFSLYKFRTMVKDAEKLTGPVWAGERDPRITFVGRFLRKARIDEFPQLINVLNGNMSLVGPRPERPYFVDRLKRQIPFYTRRLKVKPGVTGWAQIKGGYDTSIEDVKQKLEYDLFYIENLSLRMDLKILIGTFYVMIRGKGQ